MNLFKEIETQTYRANIWAPKREEGYESGD